VTVFDAPGFTDSAVKQGFFAKLGGSMGRGAVLIDIQPNGSRRR